MLTDTVIREQQMTREVDVSSILFFPFPWKKNKKKNQLIPGYLDGQSPIASCKGRNRV